MYEELVKELRQLAKIYSICENENTNEYRLAMQAADAIEELSKQHEAQAQNIIALLNEKPRWIPVTERLPENDDFVIVAIKDEHGDSPYVYSDFGWYFDRAECWIVETEQRTDITHWMPLPEPPKEETK